MSQHNFLKLAADHSPQPLTFTDCGPLCQSEQLFSALAVHSSLKWRSLLNLSLNNSAILLTSVRVHMVPYGGKAFFFFSLFPRPSIGNYIQTNVKRILRLQNPAVTSQELADKVLLT